MTTIYVTGLVLLIGLSYLDAWLTDRILTAGGIEANPLIRWLYGRWGLRGVLALKTVLAVLILRYAQGGLLDLDVLWFIVIFYAWLLLGMGIELWRMRHKHRSKRN